MDEAERVQSVSYPHIRSLSGLYIECYYLMPIEETGETRVSTDCLIFDVSLCIYLEKTNFNQPRRHWNMFFVEF